MRLLIPLSLPWLVGVVTIFGLVSGPSRSFAESPADLDVVFVLDTTGSMGGELREAKERINQLSEALRSARPNGRVRLGVVAFRDRGDAYVTSISLLSEQTEKTSRFLSQLTASGGGDGPEDVLAGLAAAIRDMPWGQGAEHRIVLVGDAPPHLDYGDPRTETLVSEARSRRLVIDSIGCRSLRGAGKSFFRDVAYRTEGRYQHIGHVSVEPGSMTDTMLESLSQPEVRSLESAPEMALERAGDLQRQAEIMTVRLVDRGCALELSLPGGLELEKLPKLRVALGDQAPEAVLVLRLGAKGHLGTGRYVLGDCLPVNTRIHVGFEGGKS